MSPPTMAGRCRRQGSSSSSRPSLLRYVGSILLSETAGLPCGRGVSWPDRTPSGSPAEQKPPARRRPPAHGVLACLKIGAARRECCPAGEASNVVALVLGSPLFACRRLGAAGADRSRSTWADQPVRVARPVRFRGAEVDSSVRSGHTRSAMGGWESLLWGGRSR